MATTSTTLVGAIGVDTPIIQVANKANLRPGDTINVGGGSGEAMRTLVVDPNGPITVYRGSEGTAGKTAADGAAVTYGPPSDFLPGVTPLGAKSVNAAVKPFLDEVVAERADEQFEKDVKEAEARAKKAAEEEAKKAAEQAKAAEKAKADAEAKAKAEAARR